LEGKALEYVVRETEWTTLRQPLDGSAGKWETAFQVGTLTISVVADGKRLAMGRRATDSDVVLIRDRRAVAVSWPVKELDLTGHCSLAMFLTKKGGHLWPLSCFSGC